MCEEEEKFDSEKQLFAEQRVVLENERRQLTDAAVKLGHEVRIIEIHSTNKFCTDIRTDRNQRLVEMSV